MSLRTNLTENQSAAAGILLISCYELGQQPLGLVAPAASLARAGFSADLMDIAVEAFDEVRVRRARLIGISVPMHTALRLGVALARRVRQVNPQAHICFYGIYAELNADMLVGELADTCLGAEFETDLVALAAQVVTRDHPTELDPAPLPAHRDGLPPPSQYAQVEVNGGLQTVGYVASTRGCKHKCRHCPLTPVYDGRFYAVPIDDVMADIAQLVDRGVEHVSFGDPDFLNGPTHALRITRRMRAAFPSVSFSYTAKIEHLLRHEPVVTELCDLGCLFVVSAVESFNDHTLRILDKGHSRADALAVFERCRHLGLTLRPSFVPFTPWDSLDDFNELLDIVAGEDLIDNVDPVQYAIRLLLPRGSTLLELPEMKRHLTDFDAERFTHEWQHPDPRMDALQNQVHGAVEQAVENGESASDAFLRVHALARSAAGLPATPPSIRQERGGQRPRMTEPWFC